MKTKIFWSCSEDPSNFEAEMNTFFEENPNINVIDKIPMSNKSVFWLVLIYEERVTI